MEDKKPKSSLWRLIYPLLIFYGAGIIASIVFGVIFSVMAVRDAGITTLTETDYEQLIQVVEGYLTKYSQYITMLQNLIVIPAGIIFMKADRKRLASEGFLKTYETPAVIFFAAAFILGIAASITGNNLISISGITTLFEDEINSVNDVIYSGGIIVEIISVCIITPIAEELVYHGLFYNRLRERSGVMVSIIISSLIFALAHGNVPQGIYAFLIGLVCAFAFEKFKNVIAPILIHMGANVFSVVASETSFLDFVQNNSTAFIAYIAVPAVLVAVLIWVIYEKVNPGETTVPSTNI